MLTLQLGLLQQRAQQFGGLVSRGFQVHALLAQRELARLDAHALEQIVDQAHQAQHAALDVEQQIALLGGSEGREAVAQHLDRGELRGERSAEFVRDVAEHAVAGAPRGFQIGLVTQQLDLAARRRAPH